ncbi:unnamed protein product [Cyprideis torosa]|uniref:alanine--tRNA ligase n=1 Tax=Cyprideis torosa TaxID=163714 RepID=A0A7R8WDW0_9CRUS|nr:unnamed protein product [Cyprideis torosa]CAG0890028.1 unnamed protein product [Cyprideis torosa]
MSKAVSSVHVRQSFKNFFHQRKHVIGRSSSIVPWNDPSLAFVNAGMNQFKRVFLGEELAPHPRLVNCQKCIRVGGKHNDLDAVGRSRRHHSFFEMLGNWSFGDYGKKEACSMAWEFLTAELGIPASNLHVTVFQGSDHFPRDEEVERIWEDIGVPRERIFARDERENFWSMGLTGPCGPCTEIHLRQSDGKELELWNIVFMGWDKQLGDGIPTFSKLGSFCIDTGLGLERLVATLEGGDSNYDTDLFQPILRRLQELTGGPSYSGLFANSAATGDEQPSDLSKDEAYRLIADHARMVTVALSDGMFPDACQKLRHVIWRAFHRLEKQFDVDAGSTANILIELSKVVESILSPEYPEISRSRRIQEILVHEEMVYRRLNSRAQELRPHLPKRVAETLELDKIHECPGILEAIADVNRIIKAGELKTRVDGSQYVPPETLGRLHRSYNVSMEKLFAILDWKSLDYDPTGWHIEDAKQEAVPLADPFLSAALAFEKVASNDQSQSPTEDDWKYQATWTSDGKVRIEPLRCTVVFAQPIRDDQLEDGRVINAGDNG